MFEQKDLKLFEKLYEDTYNTTLKYVLLKCSNIDDVKDIMQEIYIELYNILIKQKTIPLDNSRAFIVGIAKNKIKKYYGLKYKLNHISLFSKKEDMELIDNIKANINIESIIIDHEKIEDIWLFLKTKNVIITKIFYLHYYLDMTMKEISKELNISESTIKNYLYRTLKEIKKTFRKDNI